MSQAADNQKILSEMLLKCTKDEKFFNCELAVVETFYELVSVDYWESEEIVRFLESAKGIGEKADKALELFIEREKSYEVRTW